MPVDPFLEPILDAVKNASPPAARLSVAERRAQANAAMDQSFIFLTEEAPEIASVADRRIPVSGAEIAVRVYTPQVEGRLLPCHVYLHGGGFWMGTIDQMDGGCKTIAAGVGCVVVSVDYRLAPEHKIPTAAEDCYAALCWVVDHASDLGVDPSHISVGGGSAGGNLAAVVALMARDRSGPSLSLQVLEVPCLEAGGDFPSLVDNDGYILTKESISQFWRDYLADPTDALNPYASPLRAADLSGLPPAVVMTAEYDPLRDEGEAYASRLREAGVAVVSRRWEGQIHGASAMTKLLPSARECRDQIHAALREALGVGAEAPLTG